MKKNVSLKTIKLLGVILLSLGISASLSNFYSENNVLANAYYTNNDADNYYQSIDTSLRGTALLNALQKLNNSKRKSTVGYKSMGTTVNGSFKYTDYDPNHIKYDANGQPYGDAILSFYSGKSTTNFNREHVWPNSRGGDKVEADIHMTRPTISSENGSRGNSFYVEGMRSSSEGWDPAMESFGDETYRGDAARIIFYCCVASSSLKLVDANKTATKNDTMGKLSDLLKWNNAYPVTQREKNRNEGAEYLQGNRNPFIDHPEWVNYIWGDSADIPINKIELSDSDITLKIGEEKQLSATIYPTDATDKSLVWSSTNTNVVSVQNGLLQANNEGSCVVIAKNISSNISAFCNVKVVKENDIVVEGLKLNIKEKTLQIGDELQLETIFNPENASNKNILWESSNNLIAKVSANGLVTAMGVGTAIITATSEDNEKSDICIITVKNLSSNVDSGCNGNVSIISLFVSIISITLLPILFIKRKDDRHENKNG